MAVDVLEDNPDRERHRVLGSVDDQGRVLMAGRQVGRVTSDDPLDMYGSAQIYVTSHGRAEHVASLDAQSGDVDTVGEYGMFGDTVASAGYGTSVYSVPGGGLHGQPVAWIEARPPHEWDDPDVMGNLYYRGGAALLYMIDEGLVDA